MFRLGHFLANQKVTGPKYMGAYDKQVAFFSHVRGAVGDTGEAGEFAPDNTHIFHLKKFHWAWLIPIDNEIASLGLVTPRETFLKKKQSPDAYFRSEVRDISAGLYRRLPELAEKVHAIPNYSYQVRGFCGKGFICVGDAHRFIDPIFSFGLSVTMREAEFAAPIVRQYLAGELDDRENPFAEHQVACETGIDNLEHMIDLFWEQPFAFSTFVHARYRDHIRTPLRAGSTSTNTSLPPRFRLSGNCSSAPANTARMISPSRSARATIRSAPRSGSPIRSRAARKCWRKNWPASKPLPTRGIPGPVSRRVFPLAKLSRRL